MKFLLVNIFIFFNFFCQAQNGYKSGQQAADLPAKNIINYTQTASTLEKLQGNITIIDFFGTWCVPCIKALPELSAYKNKFKTSLNVILVSTESETKLHSFISAHQPFIFPVIVDAENIFTNAFQPASYPYTVVLDANRKILLITNAADLTEEMLQGFISKNKNLQPVPTASANINLLPDTTTMTAFTGSNNQLVKLSQDFLYAAKTGDDIASYQNRLKNISYPDLISKIKTDDEKKAFWINLYNAFTYSSLKKDPEQYKNRSEFFKKKNIEVAGKTFSLDEIEHGFLRHSKIKWSLGYFNKPFPSKTEKQLRVKHLDYRIHFSLNCGAKSCPPIAYYNPEDLDRQLDLATTAYLTSEVTYNRAANEVMLPALFNWFRRDFGGKKNIIKILQSKKIIPEGTHPEIKFKKYDWSLYLDNFRH